MSLRWPGRPKETDPRGSHPEIKAEDQSPGHVTAKGLRDREAAGTTPGPAHPRAGGGCPLQCSNGSLRRPDQPIRAQEGAAGSNGSLACGRADVMLVRVHPPSSSGIHAPVLKTCSIFLFLTSPPPSSPSEIHHSLLIPLACRCRLQAWGAHVAHSPLLSAMTVTAPTSPLESTGAFRWPCHVARGFAQSHELIPRLASRGFQGRG